MFELIVAVALVPAMWRPTPHLVVTKIDFTDSYPVTDREQFYLSETDGPLMSGSRKYGAIEQDYTIVGYRNSPYVVVRRGLNLLGSGDLLWYASGVR